MKSRAWIWSVLGLSVVAGVERTPVFAQDPPASQPAAETAKPADAVAQPAASSQPTSTPIQPRPVPRPRRTTTRPATTTPIVSPEASPAEIQLAQERLRKLQEMNDATTQAAQPTDAAHPADAKPAPTANPDGVNAPAVSPGGAAKSQPSKISPTTTPTTRRTRSSRTKEQIDADIQAARERARASTQPIDQRLNPSAQPTGGEATEPPVTPPSDPARPTGPAMPSATGEQPNSMPATPATSRVRRRNELRNPNPVVNPDGGPTGETPANPTDPAMQPTGDQPTPDGAGRDVQPADAGRDVVPAGGVQTQPTPTRPVGRSRRNMQPAGSQPQPQPTDGTVPPPQVPNPSGVQPAAPAHGAVVEPVAVAPPLPADGKTEFFSFKDTPWEDIVRQIAKRIGKPLMDNGVIVSGTLTYESKRRFTLQEAMDELNFLLAEQGYFIHEHTDYVYLVPLNEAEKFLDPKTQMFPTWESFVAANLRDAQLCAVMIKIEDRPAEQIRDMLASAMPDHALPTVSGNTNAIKITGMAKDARRFKSLLDTVVARKFDPRQMKVYSIKTNVMQVERMVQALLGVEPAQRKFNQQTKQWETSGGDGDVKIIADDRTNQLIVKATPEQHAEVNELIEKFDDLKDLGDFKTHVIDVKYANAGEIATMLRQIFEQEQGQARTPARFTPRPVAPRPGQPGQPGQPQPVAVNTGSVAPEDIIIEDIFERAKKTVRITSDDRTNSLICYANDDGVKRVRDMLDVIDKPIPTNYQQFKLEHVRAGEIFGLVDQLAKAVTGSSTGPRGGRGPTVTPDDASNVLHVIADKRDMTRIGDLIKELDVAGLEDTRHVIYLKSIKPSEMARIVESLLASPAGGGGAPGGVPRPGGRRGGAAAQIGQQVIALDAARMLIVNCNDEEWEKVSQTVREYDDSAITDQTVIDFYEIKHGNPEQIANTVRTLFSNYVHPVLTRVNVNATADGQRVIVNAPDAIFEEIDALIAQLDVVTQGEPLVIIPLEHAEAQTAAQYIQNQILAGGGGGRGARRGGGGGGGSAASVAPDTATNALIVQADEATLTQIRDFVAELEGRYAAQMPERRFFNPKNAEPRELVTAINTLFAATSGRGGQGAGKTAVKALQAGTQIVVEAPTEKFTEIEAVIAELDDIGDGEIVIKTIPLPGADVNSIAGRLQQAFSAKTRQSGSVVQFAADPSSETILLTCTRDMREEAEAAIADYVQYYKPLIPQTAFRQLKHGNANEAAQFLQTQLSAQVNAQLGKSVAAQLKVTPDTRTNRVIVSAPAAVVEMAKNMLDEFDVPVTEPPPPPTATETRRIPGIDVSSLAQNLQRAFDARGQRLDKLKFTFAADSAASILIFTVPVDSVKEVDDLIAKFTADAASFEPMEKHYEIQHAEATYVRDQLQTLLANRLTRTRGSQAASSVNLTVDTRLNRVFINAPKFAVEAADDLIATLDAEAPALTIDRIALKNADAQQVVQTLTPLLESKTKVNRNLKVVPDTITNSIRVTGANASDMAEIKTLVSEFDTNAGSMKAESRTFVIRNTNPWEVLNALSQKYQQRRPGQRQADVYFNVIGGDSIVAEAAPDRMEEIAKLIEMLDKPGGEGVLTKIALKYADPNEIANMINAIFANRRGATAQQQLTVNVSNGELIVRAPERMLKEIQDLVAKVDAPNPNELTVQTYNLKILRAMDVAVQVQMFLRSMGGASTKKGQMQPGAFPEPTTNTLVVIAPKEQLPFLEALLLKIENQELPISEPRMYALTNARAADVATNLQAMLDAKVVEKEGARKDAVKVKVLPEPASNRLFVMAPDEYHELAKGLVKMIDTEIDSGEIVRIVQLANAEAAQLAQTIQARVQGAAKGQPARVNVVADAGSNSIVLSGMPKDVADAQKLIGDLEEGAATTPELQIFKIVNTSTGNVLDTLEEVFPSEGSKPADKVTIVEDDFYNRLLITTNRRKMRQVEAFIKMLDVRADAGESSDPDKLPGGKELHFVDIGRGDASDIVWDVEEFFPSPSDGGPELDADWDGEYIKVICRPGEFEKIERLIRQFEARAKPEYTVKTRKLRGDLAKIAPLLSTQIRDLQIEGQPGGTPELPSLIEDLWPEGTEPGSDKGKIKPVSGPGTKAKDVQPYLYNPEKLAALAAFDETLSEEAADGAVGQDESVGDADAEDEPATQPEAKPQAPARTARRAGSQPAVEKPATAQPAAAQPAKAQQPAAQPTQMKGATPPVVQPASQKAPATSASPLREPARVVQMPDGSISISGEKAQVDAIIDALDVLEEDLEVGQVIRIFRFRFGDVTAAARILEMMFNDRAGAAMNAQMQQMQMMQQMQAQAQQQGRRNNQGGDEKDDRGGRGGNPMDMLGGLMGGGRGAQPQAGGKSGGQGATPLRIATDPSHNYLIVKCDESLLPEIRQLLRELDIKPSNVDVKVIQLKNLVATETATNIKEVLGIGRSARGGATRGGQPNMAAMQGGRNPQQAQLMEIMQQQMVSIPGMEGGDAARIDSVEIVPNDLTNSVLVSAPPEVMKIIERVITDLEKLEDRDILVIRHYKLETAQVADVLPLLQEMFDSAAGGNRATRGGPGGGGGGRGGSPADLGPVTMSGDPRSNSIIYTAQNKDIPLIEAQIKLLDFEGDFAMAESYVVEYGDASAIAAMVSEIFIGGGGGGGRRGGGDSGAATGGATNALRISAEPTTNTIVVWGTLEQRDQVFEKIEEHDKLSRRDFREIPVVFADPEKMAEKLAQLFGGTVGGDGSAPPSGGGRRNSRGGASALANIPGRIVIVPDKVSKKIFVRAPDPVFTQMNDLATKLDKVDPGLQIKTFPLKFADAQTVVDTVKTAMAEFIQIQGLVGGGETDFDAFTALADPRTNAVMVVGSEETFIFVNKILETVDIATPKDREKQFAVFVLDRANAAVVADAINSYAAGRGSAPSAGGGESGGGRRRGGGMPGMGAGSNLSSAPLLDVQAVAEESTNSVLVFGKADDIAKVQQAVIEQLEGTLREHRQFARIPVTNASPSQLASFLQPFLDESQAVQSGRGGRGGGAPDGGPKSATMIPNDLDKTLLVRGSAAQVEEIRALVEQFDRKDLDVNLVKIVPVQYGQDAVELARQVEELVNSGERSIAEKTGRQARSVTVSADAGTNAIMVYGDPSMYGLVETVVKQLEGIRPMTPKTVVRRLGNLSAEEAQALINDLQNRRSGGSGATNVIRRSGGGSGSTPSRSGGSRRITPGGGQPGSGDSAQPSNPGGGRPQGQPRNRTRPGGGNQPRGGGGDSPSFELSRRVGGGLLVGTILTWPTIAPMTALAFEGPETTSQPAKTQPAKAQPAKSQPAQTRPSRIRPATSQPVKVEDAAKDEPKAQPARPVAPAKQPAADKPSTDKPATDKIASDNAATQKPRITPVAGKPTPGTTMSTLDHELRGEVTATPLGSDTIVITGDDADVAFIEQMLDLLEQTTPEVRIQIFQLKHAKAALVQQILEQIVQSYQESKGQTQRFDRFSIIAEGRSNSLIVSASDEILDVIQQVLEEIDLDTMDVGAPQLYKLNHIRASEAATLLDPLLERFNAQAGQDRTSEARVQAVDRANSLMLIGTPQEIAEMEQVLKAIDVEIPATDSFSQARILIIDLINAKAEDLAETLEELVAAEQASGGATGGGAAGGGAAARRSGSSSIVRKLMLATADGTELPPLDLDRPIKIIPEPAKNSLIIYSSEKNNESLKQIVALFDGLPKTVDVDVKSFALQHAQSTKVAETLDKIFKDAQDKALLRPSEKSRPDGTMPPVPPNLAGAGLPHQVAIAEDPRSNSVFVVGRKEAVLLAAGIISELDKPGAELGVGYHVLPLKSLEAAALQEKLTELLDQRAEAIGGSENKARDNAIMMVDDRSNSLVVVSTDETWKMIEQIATQLDTAGSYRPVDTRYRRLRFADSAKISSLLQDVFDKKKEASGTGSGGGQAEQRESLFALADSRSNSIVLTGTRDYLDEAEKMIQDLDQEFPPTIQFKVRPLVLNSANNVATLLTEMVEESQQGGGENAVQGSPIKIKADQYSNTLLIAASAEDMQRLDRWIDRLDVKPEIGRITKIVPLSRGKAEEISQSVQELYTQSGGEGGQDITVTHDKTTNAVIAIGPPSVVNDIVSFLNQLNDTAASGSSVVKIFKLDQATAEDAGELLRGILEGRSGSVGGGSGGNSGGSSQEDALEQLMLVYQAKNPDLTTQTLKGLRTSITVIDDVRTNSLVVTAPPESMGLVESLIVAIDLPPESIAIKVLPLRNSDAEEMVTTLEELFERQGATNTSSTSGSGDSTRTLSFEGGTGSGREEVTFTKDKRTNSVIAAGTKGYLKIAEDTVLQLDSQPIKDRVQIVFEPRNAPAQVLQQMLSDLNDQEQQTLDDLEGEISASRKQERQFVAISSEDMNKIVVDVDPRRQSQIMEIIRELDQPPAQVMIQVLIVNVRLDNSLELGAEFAFQDLQFTRAGVNDSTTFDYVGGTDIGAAGAGLGGFTFTVTGKDFNFLIRTLQNEGSLSVLSRPQIIAMDNQLAKIEVTQDVPYVTGSSAVAGQITTSVGREEVGIILEVTPRINPDGFVRMEIKQEVSDLTDSTVDVGAGVSAPVFLKRNAETFVTVKDNESVVLGGLITSRDSVSENKVPILGDIPLLGILFRAQSQVSQREELLVILTPRVVRTPEDYQELSRQERDLTGNIGEDVLLNPLMQGLRVKPEELLPRQGEENIGPYPNEAEPQPGDATEDDPEIYGPRRSPSADSPKADPSSYDVPITRATPRGRSVAEARRK